MRKDIIITDISQLSEIPKLLAATYSAAVKRGLWEEASIIMNESKLECPVASLLTSGYTGGQLRASGQVGQPFDTGNRTEIRLGYSQNYAIYVHEILDNYHLPPTKAKFLEDPVNRHLDSFAANVNMRIAEAIGVV